MGLKGFGEENVPRGTIFGEILRRRGGDQKTTLGEKKEKGNLKTVVAPRKPAIYRKKSKSGFSRKFCVEDLWRGRDSAGNPRRRTKREIVPAENGLLGRENYWAERDRRGERDSVWIAGTGRDWWVQEGTMWSFVLWNGWVSLFHGARFQRGRPARTLRPPHRADGSYPGLDCWIAGLQAEKGGFRYVGKKSISREEKVFRRVLM